MTRVALQILSWPKRTNDPCPEEITPARTLQVAPELPELWAVSAGESRREYEKSCATLDAAGRPRARCRCDSGTGTQPEAEPTACVVFSCQTEINQTNQQKSATCHTK